jgi:hypothetical protein
MTEFATVFRCYCHTYLSLFPQNPRLFFVAIFSSLYPRTRCSWKQRRNYLSTGHHHQDRLIFIHRRNYDEKLWQCKNKLWKVANKSVAIVTKIYAKTKLTTQMLYVRRKTVANCDELSSLLRRVL